MNTVIAEAVAPLKAVAVERANEAINHRISEALADLEAHGFDLEKCAPYPSTRLGAAQYRAALAYNTFLRSLTNSTSSSRRLGSPDIRVAEQAYIDIVVNIAESDAAAQFDAFVNKLETKVGEVVAAELKGDAIWNNSWLTVTKADGAVETWHTKIILNVSKHGKLFNQWPTRKTK